MANPNSSFEAVLRMRIQATLKQPVDDLSDTYNVMDYPKNQAFTDGVGVNQATDTYHAVRTLADGITEDLDLSGVLKDPFGDVLPFTSVKAIYIEHRMPQPVSTGSVAPDTASNLVVGGAAANAFVGPFGAADNTIKIPPGGYILLTNPTADGWPVVAGTGDLLTMAHDSTDAVPISYAILVIGTT